MTDEEFSLPQEGTNCSMTNKQNKKEEKIEEIDWKKLFRHLFACPYLRQTVCQPALYCFGTHPQAVDVWKWHLEKGYCENKEPHSFRHCALYNDFVEGR